MSANDISFIERSVDHYLVTPFVDRAIGFRAENAGKHWFAAAGIYGESVDPNSTTGDEGWGITGRLIYAPIIEDNQIVHLGVRASTRRTASNNPSIRIRDETTHLSSLHVVDTGQLAGVEEINIFGVEGAVVLVHFQLLANTTS